MITKEEAFENVKKYIHSRKRDFVSIAPLEKVNFEKNHRIAYPHSKYYEQERDVYVISYKIEGYPEPIPYFVIVDAEKGEVLFTMTAHGYAEDWEK